MMKINTILFDLGGVLVDWSPMNVYKNVFDSEEKAQWFLDNVCTMDWNDEQDGGRLIADGVAQKIKEYPEYKEQIEMYYEKWHEMFLGIFETAVDVQQALIANPDYKVYALTNWCAEKWDKALELFPFFKDFDGVVVSGEVKMRKPHDDIYEYTFKTLKIDPKKTVYIDDNPANIEAGKRNHLHCIHCTDPNNLKEELEKFDVEI
ncbi:HAD family phosphatase [Flavobacteriaceae bacterium]|nr:HAD family phosphatase [Flavobacteriaceae bacterium]